MIPWRLAAGAAVLAAAFGGGWTVRGWRADAAELDRQQAEARTAHRRAELATRAALDMEDARDAIRSDLRATQARLTAVLAAPLPQCPAVAVGDVVLPAGALDRVLSASGQRRADADAGQPGAAVRPGAGHP